MNTSGHPHILLIVIKATSTLDFAIPLLWKIKQEDPQAKISVLYCTLTSKKILRQSTFYTDILNSHKINEYDFIDFLYPPFSAFRSLWRKLFSKSDWDSLSFDHTNFIPFGNRFAQLVQFSLSLFENILIRLVNVKQILPVLNPDIILYDNRTKTRFHGRNHFYEYFNREKKKVMLLPHAPHHTGTTSFTPFDENGEKLPKYCEYWMPFIHDKCWEVMPDKMDQFVYVGYPGLDSEWLTYLTGQSFKSANKSYRSNEAKSLKCLFIIRKFLDEGQAPTVHDALVFNYDDFLYYLNLVGDAIKNINADIEIIIKPHPSNDFNYLAKIFDTSSIPKWKIGYESIYGMISDIDLVISLYSTTLLIPAMAGIPTIILNSRIQQEMQQWEEMEQLYTGLGFFLENPDDLKNRLNEVVKIATNRKHSNMLDCTTDIVHLRRFYPDGALQRCIDRLKM